MRWKCKYCDEIFEAENDYEFEEETEEELWAHIQLQHEDVFEDVQDLDTPYMLEECYLDYSDLEECQWCHDWVPADELAYYGNILCCDECATHDWKRLEAAHGWR